MKKIVVLHGWTYNLDKWKPFVKALQEEGFETEILKIPGLTQKSSKTWDLDSYVEWVNKEISTKKQQKVILLGHSNGGRIAAAYAAKYPQKVFRLILIDSAGIYHRELYLEVKRLLFRTAAKIGKRITGSHSLKRFLYTLARERDYFEAPPETKQTIINMVESDIKSLLKKIDTPTLVIWGRNDKITPLKDAFIFNKMIRNSKLEVINGAKHSPFYTHTRKVTRILKNGI
jgi:pimeloyl-ACP methyl ester carboxylesterase